MEKKPIKIATTADKVHRSLIVSDVITPERARHRRIQTMASVQSGGKFTHHKASMDVRSSIHSGIKSVHNTIVHSPNRSNRSRSKSGESKSMHRRAERSNIAHFKEI